MLQAAFVMRPHWHGSCNDQDGFFGEGGNIGCGGGGGGGGGGGRGFGNRHCNCICWGAVHQ